MQYLSTVTPQTTLQSIGNPKIIQSVEHPKSSIQLKLWNYTVKWTIQNIPIQWNIPRLPVHWNTPKPFRPQKRSTPTSILKNPKPRGQFETSQTTL